ncbi:hypothetical protein MOY_04329 [Halomonas sp. GFAJ-1]|nr:hypothetical protein BB497_08975 [Halomonas sp. GFAJ-1]EHK61787.1 hypothetical protein MOY_04329 [Halomonas sp. GFAJ-1]
MSDDAIRRRRYHAQRKASAAFDAPTTLEFAMKPRRDTRARNLVFLITIVSALVVGLWLAR